MVILLRDGDELWSPPAPASGERRRRDAHPGRGLDCGRRAALAGARADRRRRARSSELAAPGTRGAGARPRCSCRSSSAAARSACSPPSTASSGDPRLRRRGRAAAAGLRGQRRDRGRHRPVGRAERLRHSVRGGRARAPPLGARAARRDAPGARRAAGAALLGAARRATPTRLETRAHERRRADRPREIESLRTLITELRPAALDELGLAAGARDLARAGAGQSRAWRSS